MELHYNWVFKWSCIAIRGFYSVRRPCMNLSFAECIPTYRGPNVHEAPGLKQTEIHHKRHQTGADYIPQGRSTD
uniref:Uncharacterized protein n=1 Tax=Trichuris muris TaxID=70415 RepID=A0A5S6Q4N6_TRIMR